MAEIKRIGRGGKIKDISGQTFGHLTALTFLKLEDNKAIWRCLCICGRTVELAGYDLRRGSHNSCGCMRGKWNRRHGMYRSREYKCWLEIKNRCLNPNFTFYMNYGGRGITMSTEWRDSFEAFYEDMGTRPAGTSIDRIDNDGPYTGPCPEYPNGNCRWATRVEQMNNRRNTIRITHENLTLTASEWSERTGLSSDLIRERLRKGLNPPELFEPCKGKSIVK